MTPDRGREAALGMAVVAIAALLFFVVTPAGVVMPKGVETDAIAPDFWPRIVIVAAALAGAAIAVRALVRPDPDDGETAESVEERDGRGPPEPLRAAAVFAALVAFYLALPWLGFVLGGAALAGALLWLGGERRLLTLLPAAALPPVVLQLFFAHVAHLPVPLGVLELIW